MAANRFFNKDALGLTEAEAAGLLARLEATYNDDGTLKVDEILAEATPWDHFEIKVAA